MAIDIFISCSCDVCGGPLDSTVSGGEYNNTSMIKTIAKIEKAIRKLEKRNKAKIAKTSGRVICKNCTSTANKSPKWSKG